MPFHDALWPCSSLLQLKFRSCLAPSYSLRYMLMLWVALALSVSTAEGKCQSGTGVSLLAHKSHIQKSSPEVPEAAELPEGDPAGDILIPSFSSYDWCHCGGVGYHCDLLQTDSAVSPHLSLEQEASLGYNWTWQCHHELCGANYPASAYTCLDVQGTCVGPVGNCLYTTDWVVNTSEDCGYRKCFCATVPPGQCTSENFPGYIIVQNGAFNVTTGTRWYPVGDGKEYPPDLREWEPVGGPGNHACRGDNSSDNDPRHYEVHDWIHSLWGCKNYCERTDFCTGIEYSAGRCEIWKRSLGIYHFKEIPVEKGEFTCLRYGWPTSKLVPVGPNGTSHPCRGRSSHDNHPEHYRVVSGIRDLEECKAICAAWTGEPCYGAEYGGCAPKCSGIEFSLGRCELWLVEIESVNPNVDGYTCLKFDFS